MAANMSRCLLALLALGACGASCPRDCRCPNVGEHEYEMECGPAEAGVEVTAKRNDYVNVKCEVTDTPCSLVPVMDLASGADRLFLALTGCRPHFLGCVMAAINATRIDDLYFNSIPVDVQPEDLRGVKMKRLKIYDSSNVHRVPSETLRTVGFLREIRIHRAELKLFPDQFLGASAIYLELSDDQIASLPAHAFRGLSRLKQLQLWENKIRSVDVTSFEGLDSVTVIGMNRNQIPELPAGVFAGTPQLQDLDLSMNSLRILTAGVFTPQTLEKISISSNKEPLTLGNQTFANLPALKTLLLDGSQISSVPGDLFQGSSSIKELNLSQNQLVVLPDEVFQSLVALETLDLSHNKIQNLTAALFSPLKSLVTLNLNRNHIQVLPERLFSGLTNFQTLTMNQNELYMIDPNAFQGADSLVHLSMAENHLSFQRVGEEYFNMVVSSPFWMLKKLRNLVLRQNQLEDICDDWKMSLLELNKLDLSYNKFSYLTDVDLQFLGNQIIVDLSNNNISTIIVYDSLQPPLSLGEAGSTSPTVILDNNPFNCDCYMYQLSLSLQGWVSRTGVVQPHLELGNARCSSPTDLKGQLVTKIRPDYLTCGILKPDCPEVCHCLMRPSNLSLELDCEYLPKNLSTLQSPAMKNLNLQLRNVTGLSTLQYKLEDLNLNTTLILRNLSLDHIPKIDVTDIEILDLRDNQLSSIPIELIKTGVRLYLSGNDFKCSCWNRNDIVFIRNQSNIIDISSVTCAGQNILEIQVESLCAVRDASIAAVGVVLILIILATIAYIMIYKHKQEILVYLLSRGYLTWLITEEVVDSNKPFDVFVSFSHKDADFILDKLMPKLENDFSLKVCVHYRDWIVGEMIPQQIVASVEHSRRTVIVLSRSFLSSMWAKLEFRAAHAVALREGRARVVLIILEDEVLNDQRLDEELQAYVSTNTYLKVDDSRFWDRLRKALPSRERKFKFLKKFRGDRRREHSGVKKVGKGGLDVQLNSRGQLINAAVEKDIV